MWYPQGIRLCAICIIFCQCSDTLQEAEAEGEIIVYLVEDISMFHTTQAVTWAITGRFCQLDNKILEQRRLESLKNLQLFQKRVQLKLQPSVVWLPKNLILYWEIREDSLMASQESARLHPSQTSRLLFVIRALEELHCLGCFCGTPVSD